MVYIYMFVFLWIHYPSQNPTKSRTPKPQNRLDFDDETHGDAFLAPKGFRGSQRALRPDYGSLRQAVASATGTGTGSGTVATAAAGVGGNVGPAAIVAAAATTMMAGGDM